MGNPRFWTLAVVSTGAECRNVDAWVEAEGFMPRPFLPGSGCAAPASDFAISGDFRLTDGTTSATFTVTQVEPVVGGMRFMAHPSSPQRLSVTGGQRVAIDMGVPAECLPADFDAQLAANRIDRANDGTLSVLAQGGLTFRLQALCVTKCMGATCNVTRPPDEIIISFATP